MNLFCVFLFMYFQEPISQNGESLISWSADRPLTWSDFKGRPELRGQNGAMTSSGIEFRFESAGDSLYFSVITTFNQKTSWVNRKLANEEMLIHEQLHFNITELFSRKLRRALKGMDSEVIGQDITARKLYSRYMKECSAMQRLYDKETDHSRNQKTQNDWNQSIMKELNELENQSAPTFKILYKRQ